VGRAARPAGHADCGDRQEKSLTYGFVFTTRRGRPMSPYTLTKHWHDVREAAELSLDPQNSRVGDLDLN
jgi:hypothetical protein